MNRNILFNDLLSMGKSVNGKELGNAIYQRTNGTYEARYIDRFGKMRSVYAKTLTEVSKKRRKKIFENEKQINVVDENLLSSGSVKKNSGTINKCRFMYGRGRNVCIQISTNGVE